MNFALPDLFWYYMDTPDLLKLYMSGLLDKIEIEMITWWKLHLKWLVPPQTKTHAKEQHFYLALQILFVYSIHQYFGISFLLKSWIHEILILE